MTGHDETVRREFAKQAATFEDPDYSFADRRLMAWIESNVPAEPDAAVLDVAGGTGHMGRAYARTSAVAVVLDLTEEMLATGQARAKAAGQGNVVFMRGDAARMELIDESFDLVLSRFAVHHFARPEQQIAEMVRVCRTRGRVAVIDLVAEDGDRAAAQDRLERMRDPSHTRVLPLNELRALIDGAGASVFHETFRDHRLPVERWLAQAGTAADKADAIRKAIRDDIDGGAASGMRPSIDNGELYLTHRYAIVVGRKADVDGQLGRATR